MLRSFNRWLRRRAWFSKSNLKAEKFGITIIDSNLDPDDDQRFLRVVSRALSLVKRFDERRFRRIQRHIRFIINVEMLSQGRYIFKEQVCLLNFGCLMDGGIRGDDQVHDVASTLVHEATHGEIWARGFHGTREIRVEELCVREEFRFLSRIDPRLASERMKDHNPEYWIERWNLSRWQYWKEFVRYLWWRSRKVWNSPE